jgi:ketosteroid isomerase-like protein
MHPNAELMRKASDLLNAGDIAGFLALHTDDVVMHIAGRGPLAGEYLGREGIEASMQKEMQLLDGPPSVEPHDDLASDQHAVSLVIQTLRRGGRTLEARTTVIAHIEDGLFSEVWLQPEDQAAYDEFFESS